MEAELERRRAAFHEAGHALAALRLDIPFKFVTIAADNPCIRRAHYRPRHDRGAECMAIFCLSGGAAEELLCGPGNCGDVIDHSTACEALLRRYSGAEHLRQLTRARLAARDLVRTARREIEIVARELLRCDTLNNVQIADLLQRFELCLLRSGGDSLSLLLPAPPCEQSATRKYQSGQSGANDRTRNGSGVGAGVLRVRSDLKAVAILRRAVAGGGDEDGSRVCPGIAARSGQGKCD
jgi:hypothetical protein